jgi:transcriptional regulator with XRE-family HTH domain
MPSDTERRLLADFLRAHRERLAPAAVGLADGMRRRRTPGLRCEEVADLAGLSLTWYTWLEQARAVSASPQALARLAEALRLAAAERAYLFELARRRDPAGPSAVAPDAPPEGLVAAADGFRGPAYVLDGAWTAVAWNAAAERLFKGWLGGPERNLVRYIFLEPSARRFIVGWEERAKRVMAELRADVGRDPGDPRRAALVEALAAASPEFARWWRAHAVTGRDGGRRDFAHPEEGPVAYRQLTLAAEAHPGFRLVLLDGPIAATPGSAGGPKSRA